ncbi:MAG: ROK family transcriptional regulator [Rhodobacter sp.]|nr:ROK family transcriptional regulator [Rhodobacter sp.]
MQQQAESLAGPAEASAIRGSNQSGMRAHNERLVLSLIRQRGPLAKAEIARVSGLSAQTVSVIMRALEAEGLLVKGDPVRGKVGQPSVPMRLAADGAYFLGLKVGRRSVELVLTDFVGKVLHRTMRTHGYPTPEATVAFALEKIGSLTANLTPLQQRRIAGLGIAMPFYLWNWAQTIGVPEREMAGWRTADIRSSIAEAVDFPVFLQNDASAACGAEVVFGPADQPKDFLYFYVGYFIGGGVVLNGSLFTGRGNAGALGPLPVPAEGGEVRQLIDVASLVVLEMRLRAAGVDTASLWTGTEFWGFDDRILTDWTESAAAGLAYAVTTACAVMDFEAVLIDGWIPANLRSRLVAATDRHLDRHNLTGLQRPAIRPGTVGADARALGAAGLPLSERFLVDQSGAV